MSTLMRLISLILIVAAIALLGADAVTSLERGGQVVVRSTDEIWGLLGKTSLAGFKTWTHNNLPGFLAQIVYSFLVIPGWGVVGVPGVILAFVFGHKPADD